MAGILLEVGASDKSLLPTVHPGLARVIDVAVQASTPSATISRTNGTTFVP